MDVERLKELDDTDFRKWVEHPITQLLLSNTKIRSEYYTSEIINSDNFEPKGLNTMVYFKGVVAAYKELFAYNYEVFNQLRQEFIEVNNDNSNRHSSSGGT